MNKVFESTVHKQRFILGLVCGLLPILDIIFGLLIEHSMPQSISITYYSVYCIIMIAALTLCTFFLSTYEGYDMGDRIWTILAALGSFGVMAFPCYNYGFERIGLFNLSAEVSNILHFVSAFLVFGSFGIMTLTQFTKGGHKKRNILYRVCGIVMIAALAMLGITMAIPVLNFHGATMVYELIMLEAFAVAWLTKSGIFFKK